MGYTIPYIYGCAPLSFFIIEWREGVFFFWRLNVTYLHVFKLPGPVGGFLFSASVSLSTHHNQLHDSDSWSLGSDLSFSNCTQALVYKFEKEKVKSLQVHDVLRDIDLLSTTYLDYSGVFFSLGSPNLGNFFLAGGLYIRAWMMEAIVLLFRPIWVIISQLVFIRVGAYI